MLLGIQVQAVTKEAVFNVGISVNSGNMRQILQLLPFTVVTFIMFSNQTKLKLKSVFCIQILF